MSRKAKTHPVIARIREELHKHRGAYPELARRAGITPRSVRALSQGTMGEMIGSRELALAEALGFEVICKMQKKRGRPAIAR